VDEKEVEWKREMAAVQGDLVATQDLLQEKKMACRAERRKVRQLQVQAKRLRAAFSGEDRGGLRTTTSFPFGEESAGGSEQGAGLDDAEEEGEEEEEEEEEEEKEEVGGQGSTFLAMERRVQELEREQEILLEEQARSRGALHARDDEIARLVAMVEGEGEAGREGSRKMVAGQRNAKIVEQLNEQVDFLNEQLAAKDRQLEALGVREEGGGEEALVGGQEARRVLRAHVSQLQKEKVERLQELAFVQDRLKATEEELEEVRHALAVAVGGERGMEEKEWLRRECMTWKEKASKLEEAVGKKVRRVEMLEEDFHGVLHEKEGLKARMNAMAAALSAARAEAGRLRHRAPWAPEGGEKEGGAKARNVKGPGRARPGFEDRLHGEDEEERRRLRSRVESLERALEGAQGEEAAEEGDPSGQIAAVEEDRRRLLSLLATANARINALEGTSRTKADGEKALGGREGEEVTVTLAEVQRELLLLQTAHAAQSQELEAVMRDSVREKDAYHEALARLEVARAELARKEEQVEQFKSLFDQLHTGRDQINVRLQQSYAEITAAEEREREAKDKAQRLDRRVAEKEEEVEKLQRLIREMEEERQALQGRLEQSEETETVWKREQAQYERTLRRMEGDLEEKGRQREAAREALAGKEREGRVLERKMAGLEMEAGAAKKMVHSRLLEIRALRDDLMIMTREAQATQGQLQRAEREREEYQQVAEESRIRAEEAEGSLRGMEAERNDLLGSYKAAQEEVSRLTYNLNQLGRAQREQQMTLGQTRAALLSMEKDLVQERREKAQTLAHAAEMSADGERGRSGGVRDHPFVEQDVGGAAGGLEHRGRLFGRESGREGGRAADVVEARALAAETERERMRRLYGEEQARVKDMEEMIASSRRREAMQAREMTRLMRSNMELREALRDREGKPGIGGGAGEERGRKRGERGGRGTGLSFAAPEAMEGGRKQEGRGTGDEGFGTFLSAEDSPVTSQRNEGGEDTGRRPFSTREEAQEDHSSLYSLSPVQKEATGGGGEGRGFREGEQGRWDPLTDVSPYRQFQQQQSQMPTLREYERQPRQDLEARQQPQQRLSELYPAEASEIMGEAEEGKGSNSENDISTSSLEEFLASRDAGEGQDRDDSSTSA
jgi:chromosome segregation ATPase